MRSSELLESLDHVREDLLAQSEQPMERKRPWLKTLVAACLALAVGAGAICAAIYYAQRSSTIPAQIPDTTVPAPSSPQNQDDTAQDPVLPSESILIPPQSSEPALPQPEDDTDTTPSEPTEHDMMPDPDLSLRVADCFGFDGGAVTNVCMDLAGSFTPNVLWDSASEQKMPVYQNLSFLGQGAPGVFLYASEMDEIVQSMTDWLDAEIVEKEIRRPSDLGLDEQFAVTDATPVLMRVTTTRGEIELTGSNVLTVRFTPPLTPFDDYEQSSFASRADTLLELADHYSQHLNEALGFLSSRPGVALSVQGYAGAKQPVTTCYAWQSSDGPDAVSSLVNHDLNRLELHIDEQNRLTDIRYVNYPVVKLGDYDAISYDEALQKLEQGQALSLVDEKDVKGGKLTRDVVADVSLTYRPTESFLCAMPFYCFLVELEDQSDVPEGTVQYGQFYVPMLDEAALEDYPGSGF